MTGTESDWCLDPMMSACWILCCNVPSSRSDVSATVADCVDRDIMYLCSVITQYLCSQEASGRGLFAEPTRARHTSRAGGFDTEASRPANVGIMDGISQQAT